MTHKWHNQFVLAFFQHDTLENLTTKQNEMSDNSKIKLGSTYSGKKMLRLFRDVIFSKIAERASL